ncbi:MAG: zf-HC2 domain-containing protein [Lachnospiraceae bacterium]
MKLSCDVIKDLLVLNEDDLCSEDSRKLIEEHLKSCVNCQRYMSYMKNPLPIPQVEEKNPEAAVLQKSLHRVKHRWMRSILCGILVFVLLVGGGYLGYNEYRQQGICLSSLDDIYQAWHVMKCLEQGDFETVVNMVDYQEDYDFIMEVYNGYMEKTDTIDTWYAFDVNEVEFYTVNDELWISKMDDWTAINEEIENTAVTTISIEGKEYSYLSDNLNIGIWNTLLYNHYMRIMIPENIWEKAVGGDYIQDIYNDLPIYQIAFGYYNDRDKLEQLEMVPLDGYGKKYCKVNSQWGVFYMDSDYIEDLTESQQELVRKGKAIELDPMDIYWKMDFMPYAVVEDGVEIAKTIYADEKESFMEYYGDVIDLSKDEYVEKERNILLSRLEEYAKTMQIQVGGYQFAYRLTDGSWMVEINITEMERKNKKNQTHGYITVKIHSDGTIDFGGGGGYDRESLKQLINVLLE